jgi:hypothetical protein
MVDLEEMNISSYVSEPDRGRRDWEGKPVEKAAVYANRRLARGKRAKRLMQQRGELIERSFAHNVDRRGIDLERSEIIGLGKPTFGDAASGRVSYQAEITRRR